LGFLDRRRNLPASVARFEQVFVLGWAQAHRRCPMKVWIGETHGARSSSGTGRDAGHDHSQDPGHQQHRSTSGRADIGPGGL
jgi:hypothetical protein